MSQKDRADLSKLKMLEQISILLKERYKMYEFNNVTS